MAREFGLSEGEYNNALEILGRQPTYTELGIISVMWSEHCSYKSSKKWLMTLPTTGPQVICGPGENAGVVDAGDGDAIIFKMESHNHPSYIEPFQGAATGVGGILRDVFTMGARPIANMNALRFGAPEHPKTRHLVSGVVAGIAHYGNCVGVPTIGGETNFHPAYNGNILVNAMTVGVAKADRIFYSAAAGVGNPVVYVGSKTGRDGIHGATMASAEFSEDSEEKRPTVQVGDPFTEKLLIEACLELMETDAIVAIQDMGAAGLTSSSVEMAGKGGLGIELVLDDVPMREEGMTPYEIMLSESQERMLIILKPGREDVAKAIFDKWELDFAVIGTLTDTGKLVIKMHGQTWCDMPIAPVSNASPLYDRPWEPTPAAAELEDAVRALPADKTLGDILETIMSCPDQASKRWIWEQYDSLVNGDTRFMSGQADAGVVRLPGQSKGIAVTTDCTPRYCLADPVRGGAQAVAEAYRNLSAVGALPLAVTDNMNFGNPEKPRIMGQFVGAIQGMADACRALDFPVVSGNVSLYNETNGEAILPTPAIGAVGLLPDAMIAVGIAFKNEGDTILLVGEGTGHLGQSLYLREILGREDGPPPPVDLAVERRNGEFVRGLIAEGLVVSSHDIQDGGLLVTVAEMAMAGGIGATLSGLDGADAGTLFGEDQGRYVLAVRADKAATVQEKAKAAGVPVSVLGKTNGTALTGRGGEAITIARLKAANEAWLPGYMAAAE
ncbi:phosphoribosylformylglycinamidine synthase subunit PurL [Azospirillum brasilense]|uniref:Phosphoribosylformylglycinamidine synthase subunit PurL n=1 Tax=Azospirillum brasilense TaxID=192 RepID=A0A0P0EC58_AZOBR|nr:MULTISPECIES: phosphoribosylformylglycinamidine synthase subunit PurL [Azospirillum]ALJ36590.1 phosphoribosylformylglycinamidine synthase [Azospirillum brasilense]MDW7552395.1 phosphoribosylformylglycinamidine synthase subunit PurL [Azospirillum brasilense]MDW7592415.1 phosphoribosylformylglycinamidine synthase subunit PurL [Azospirillum brasilense]MDW7627545.1 phosphoribosylformylglycinamidine synthase subunit PurL [Azospirillum brasilense]MDW7628890.1 phosphoribosylformylglycinamidine syn